MRIFDVALSRPGAVFDRTRDRHTFLWCAGPRGRDPLVHAFERPAECGATVLVGGEADDAVYAALGKLGWTRDGERALRCPEHA